MSGRRPVVVLANDVVPGMGVPVAAPGLRAWGIAAGLREHGYDVTVVVDERVAGIAWRYHGGVPPATPAHTLVASPRIVADLCRRRDAEALVVTNSNHVPHLGDLGRTRLVYDFFAPKMLELAEQAPPDRRERELARLSERKQAALARSDAVIVNGAKKVPYVRDWLARSGAPDLPLEVVVMPLPPVAPRPLPDGPVRAVVSGYLQPWSALGLWAAAVRPFLDDGTIELHVLLGSHWGAGGGAVERPRDLVDLTRHPAVRHHPTLPFGDFRRLLASCHLSLDVFARNPERELAMVTRTTVALSCGLPVLHVPFTETGPIIADHDAGWLVEPEDVAAMQAVLAAVTDDPAELARARAGAVAVSERVLAPGIAVAPLVDLLERAPVAAAGAPA